jgi:hypothetical protein
LFPVDATADSEEELASEINLFNVCGKQEYFYSL